MKTKMKQENEKKKEETEQQAATILESYDQGLGLIISKAEKLINPVLVADDRQEILTLLFIKGLQTLKGIDLLCSTQLYTEALILVRSLIELTTRFVQIAKSEEELKRYIAFVGFAQYKEAKQFRKAAPDDPNLISNEEEWFESRKRDYEKFKDIFNIGWSKDGMQKACSDYGLKRLFPMYMSFCNPTHSNILIYKKYVKKVGKEIYSAEPLLTDKFLAYSVSEESFLIILKYFSSYLKIKLDNELLTKISEIQHLYKALQ